MLFPSLAAAALVALASFASASPVNSARNVARAQRNNAANLTSQLQPIIAPPTPPEFKWLYTAIVKCPPNVLRDVVGPYGQRKAIPIVGGYLEGPGINGTFRDLGLGRGRPTFSIFSADTRYNAVLSDGSDLYFNTYGPVSQDGSLHLHIKIETSSASYYHLNHVVAVGVLHNLGHDDLNVSTLRIDAFDASRFLLLTFFALTFSINSSRRTTQT
ncbi:hypothetical protein JCM10295v2_005047 [Rhodotorula toruloides]